MENNKNNLITKIIAFTMMIIAIGWIIKIRIDTVLNGTSIIKAMDDTLLTIKMIREISIGLVVFVGTVWLILYILRKKTEKVKIKDGTKK